MVLHMQAVRWHGKGDVRLEDVDLEAALRPGMVEVEVAFCGVCGSDVAEYAHGPFAIRERPHPLSGQAPPLTLGHELAGRVVAVGDGVEAVAVGERVAADACWRCNRCRACRTGRYNLCPLSGSIGLCSDGGFASRVRFPAYCAIPLPAGVSDRAGAMLEPLAVAVHALDRVDARAGEVCVVLGFGAIGASSALVGRATGLDVLVSEPGEERRARAVDLGFRVHAPDGSPRDVARAVRELTDGGADVVVDASGAPAALEAAPDMTVRGGRVALVGLPKRPPALDPARQLVLYERSLVASLGYAHDLPRAAAMIAAGALDPEPLVTKEIPLEALPEELEDLARSPVDVKVLVDVGAG
jgi:(R,R)-butanediol dehydrogenase/meso-butanediol dehydrogenase/diacetyl reductase